MFKNTVWIRQAIMVSVMLTFIGVAAIFYSGYVHTREEKLTDRNIRHLGLMARQMSEKITALFVSDSLEMQLAAPGVGKRVFNISRSPNPGDSLQALHAQIDARVKSIVPGLQFSTIRLHPVGTPAEQALLPTGAAASAVRSGYVSTAADLKGAWIRFAFPFSDEKPFDSGAGFVALEAQYDARNLFSSVINDNYFSSVALLHDDSTRAAVLTAIGTETFPLQQLDSLRTPEGGSVAWASFRSRGTTLRVLLSGTRYLLFLQPLQLQMPYRAPGGSVWSGHERRLMLAGLVRDDTFNSDARAIQYGSATLLALLLAVLLLLAPMLKLLLIKPFERMKRTDAVLTVLSVTVGTAFTALLITYTVHELAARQPAADAELRALSRTVQQRFAGELELALDQLQRYEGIAAGTMPDLPDQNSVVRVSSLLQRPSKGYTRSGTDKVDLPPRLKDSLDCFITYPFFLQLYCMDNTGAQLLKWSTGKEVAKLNNSGEREYFWRVNNNAGARRGPQNYWMQPLTSRGTGTFVPTLSLSMHPTNTRGDNAKGDPSIFAVGAMDFDPLSLVRPVLPHGYGFAVIDATGLVQFHSSTEHNLTENFLDECDRDEQVTAALRIDSEEPFNAVYLGKDYRMQASVLHRDLPWKLIVFQDQSLPYTLRGLALSSTAALFGLYALPFLIGAFAMFRQHRRFTSWVWLQLDFLEKYRFLLHVLYVCIVVAVFCLLFDAAGVLTVLLLSLLSCLSIGYSYLLFNEQKRSDQEESPNIENLATMLREKVREAKLRRMLAVTYRFLSRMQEAHWRILGIYVLVTVLFMLLIVFTFPVALCFQSVQCLGVPLLAYAGWRYLKPRFSAAPPITVKENDGSVPEATRVFVRLVLCSLTLLAVLPGLAFYKLMFNFQTHIASPYRMLRDVPAFAERSNAVYQKFRSNYGVPINDSALQTLGGYEIAAGWPSRYSYLDITYQWKPSRDAKNTSQAWEDHRLTWLLAPFTESMHELRLLDARSNSQLIGPMKKLSAMHPFPVPSKPKTKDSAAVTDTSKTPVPDSTGVLIPNTRDFMDLILTSYTLRGLIPNIILSVLLLGLLLGLLLTLRGVLRFVFTRAFLLDIQDPTPVKPGVMPSGNANLIVKWNTALERERLLLLEDYPSCVVDLEIFLKDFSTVEGSTASGATAALQTPEQIFNAVMDTCKYADAVVLDHFEYRADSVPAGELKLLITEHLVTTSTKRVVLVTAIDPMYYFTLPYANANNTVPDPNVQNRWTRLFSGFSELPATALIEGTATSEARDQDIRKRCEQKMLTHAATQALAAEGKYDAHVYDAIVALLEAGEAEGVSSYGQIQTLVLERCRSLYRGIWMKYGRDEKLLMMHLAQDGFVSHAALRIVETLKRDGIIVRDPSLRLFNDSFRSFVASVRSEAEIHELEKGYEPSAWNRVKLPLITVLVSIVVFLYISQPTFLSSGIAFITMLSGLIPMLLKLASSFRGEKAAGGGNG